MNETQINELNKKLDPRHIAERQQSGSRLSYIEGHHAIREANRIFGFDAWERLTDGLTVVQCEQKPKANSTDLLWYVGYTCKSRVIVDGVVREGVGFGQGIDRDLGKAHESAIKEAETDAMKRAMMTFGDPFGLALYDKAKSHVGTDETPQAGSNGHVDPTHGAVAGYVKPKPMDKEKVSLEEKQRNVGLFINRVLFAGLPMTLKANQETAKEFRKKFQQSCPDPDKWVDVMLDAEQEDCSTPDEAIVYAASLPRLKTADSERLESLAREVFQV
jgi:DNA recombination protein Rad52